MFEQFEVDEGDTRKFFQKLQDVIKNTNLRILILAFILFICTGGTLIIVVIVSYLIRRTAIDTPVGVIESSARFATEVLQNLMDESHGNILFSPFCIHVGLAMLYMGVDQEKASRLEKKLFLPNQQIIANDYKFLLDNLSMIQNISMLTASKWYLQNDYKIDNMFLYNLKNNFYTEIAVVDFRKTKQVVDDVNEWVENKTDGMIRNLITFQDINELTRMLLLNIISFKGQWKFKFDSQQTYNEPFYYRKNLSKNVSTMHQTGYWKYKESDSLNLQILQLPFADESLTMTILLPNDNYKPEEFRDKLKDIKLLDMINDLEYEKINLSLPKFLMVDDLKLKNLLMKMGMEELFEPGHGLYFDENLFIDDVITKASFEITEDGAEASGVTSVNIISRGLFPAINFQVNRPFMFILERKGILYFMGFIIKP